jgi:hypothetical protein
MGTQHHLQGLWVGRYRKGIPIITPPTREEEMTPRQGNKTNTTKEPDRADIPKTEIDTLITKPEHHQRSKLKLKQQLNP